MTVWRASPSICPFLHTLERACLLASQEVQRTAHQHSTETYHNVNPKVAAPVSGVIDAGMMRYGAGTT
jgi:hypothetical protein